MNYSCQIGTQPFSYTEPWEHKFDLVQAVKALSFIPRFGGHVGGYSVAQHCVLVSVIAKGHEWDGLAHDLAEAYYGDFPTPLKALMRETAPTFMARIDAIDMAVEQAFSFIAGSIAVKRADQIALATERRDLLPKACAEIWQPLPPPLRYTIYPLLPAEAEAAWWKQYHVLLALGKAPKFPGVPPRLESVLTKSPPRAITPFAVPMHTDYPRPPFVSPF